MKIPFIPSILFSVLLIFSIGCKDTTFEITNEGSSNSGATQIADITGKVTDDMGNPLAGVQIVTLPFNREIVVNDIGRKIISDTVTDSQGDYLIPDLPQGTYKLLFLASGFIKVSLTIGSVDFVPENLVDGVIVKGAVLPNYPLQNDGDIPEVALFDPEDKKRMTELLTSHGIRYNSIVGKVSQLDAANHNLLIVGLDATVFDQIEELIDNVNILDRFLEDGGSIYFGQINDFSFEATPVPFLTGDQQFALHTEDAPFNDFTSGSIVDQSHPLVTDVTFENWQYIEAGQQAVKESVVFDAALKSSIENSPNWNIIVTAPAEDFTSGAGTVLAGSDVIIAEYTDPRSGSKIVLNQAAFYQATFGDTTDVNGTKLSNNVINYIKQLNMP
ncbi:carboxypeptidase regulatory-like domain-containing protein [Aliikangiella marina]|uniref:Carboxypeptidase regulatory-like domain-containing protein n=1 Tax=Aliikangiella marina TaxID=1712262 RepID=A0A545TJV0_9GAMM|nr:carboxypeptidase-like regulatory domain-containing protein [Aliikangiella marina]TQV77503.1 carboxypeptidase regulatory-like domain-containing protein [Aliikangiella marina]